MNTVRDDRSEGAKAWINRREIHDRWEDQYRNAENDLWYARRFDALIRRLGLPHESAALDVGCGVGENSVRLAERGFQVTGIDYSEAILPDATANIERHGLSDRIEVRRGDILNLDLPDGAFDLVLCWGVLMHIPDAARAVSQLARVVRPAGWLVFEEVNMRSPESRLLRAFWRWRKKSISVARTPAGSEQSCEFAGEGAFWRHADLRWLQSACESHGLDLVRRESSQFSGLYTHLRRSGLQRLVRHFNLFALRWLPMPRLACNNVLLFRKRPQRI